MLQVGGALGLAVLATLSTTESHHLRSAGRSTVASLVGGYHLAFLIGAGLVLAATTIAVVVLQPPGAEAGAIEAQESARGGTRPAYSEAA
jgi:hypothetical protein